MTGLFSAAAATFASEQRDCMQRLYQWLSERASFFRHDAAGHGTSSTVRTETTVRREGMTLLVGGAASVGLDICPLCGSKLAPTEAERANLRLLDGSISQETGPIDSQPP
jgi:hypothetical protein